MPTGKFVVKPPVEGRYVYVCNVALIPALCNRTYLPRVRGALHFCGCIVLFNAPPFFPFAFPYPREVWNCFICISHIPIALSGMSLITVLGNLPVCAV